MSSKWLGGTGLAIGVVLLLAFNVLTNATLKSVRLDLTEGQLYTLSEGSKKIVDALDEPVTLRLFLSQKLATRLPGISSYAQRVRELADEYRRAAPDKIRLQVIDPEPFSEDEDRAVAYGLQGVPLSDSDAVFYFGLVVTSALDDEATIAFFSPDREAFLEYDITKLIHQVANPDQTVVGLLSTLSMEGVGPQGPIGGQLADPWIILEQMRQLFEVRALGADIEAIPEDVDVLMLVHPKGLAEQTLYAIDQFVLRGGRALVFVDPHAESEQTGGMGGMGGGGASELGKLLDAWGVELTAAKVVGDIQLAERVRVNTRGRAVAVQYPVWMRLEEAQLDTEDIVTADLGNVLLASAGALSAKDGVDTELTPLMETTDRAMAIDVARVAFTPDPEDLLRRYRPGGKPITLAARVTGKAKSAFSERPAAKDPTDNPADPDGLEAAVAADEASHLAESEQDINLIVVADTDLLRDRFWVREQSLLGTRIAIPTASNASFVINALDNLAGSNALISVRGRGHYSRPFTRIDTIRQEATLRFREKEQQLLDRLKETERKLVELEQGKRQDNALVLSAAQREEIARFREEKIRTRKELRDVRHALRKDIERLEGWLKFMNIGLVPLLIAGGGIAAGAQRLRRRKRPRNLASATA